MVSMCPMSCFTYMHGCAKPNTVQTSAETYAEYYWDAKDQRFIR